MDRGMVSRRYAKALLMYAGGRGKEKVVYEQMLTLSKNYEQYPALHRIVCNVTLSDKKREEVFCEFAGGEVSREFRNFVKLIVKKKREDFMQMIALVYEDLYRQNMNILNVKLITAVPTDEATQHEIISKLIKETGKTVNLKVEVDPSIIGGYIIRTDAYRLDVSVTARLRRIKRGLTDTSNNSISYVR